MIFLNNCQRKLQCHASLESLEDEFAGSACQFLRFPQPADHTLPGVSHLQTCPAGGWLLEGQEAAFWLPRFPVARKLDAQGHILDEREAPLSDLKLDVNGLTVSLMPPSGYVVDCVLWRITPKLKDDLSNLSPIEIQGYFLWGSHTRYAKPADLYLHLIHGWVYENRATWPKYWKICSENDAHALYVLFSGLERVTGKTLYRLFKQQLLLSVLHRQSGDGGFYHGEWTDGMESHFRLHTSALHLLLDAYAEHPDSVVAQALAQGFAFLSGRCDRLAQGPWFLHDSLELSAESMRQSPFRWLPSRAFGKSESNMLVLNTHWDTTVALERAARLLTRPEWSQTAQAANQATLAVLAARPVEWLYRIAFGPISLSFLPTPRAAALPLWQRALKRLGWKYLIPRFHYLKRRFPRLVMPPGYLDRALSLKGISTPYQAINVMDLVRLKRSFPELDLRPRIAAAIDFTYESGLWERWAEEEKTRYSFGFWAEALYHLCLLDPDLRWRRRLAETMLKLERLGLGQPPSLLGANREAIEPVLAPCNLAALPPPIRIADLSKPEKAEILLLHSGEEPLSLNLKEISPSSRWQNSRGEPIDSAAVPLPPGSWVIGR